jgi:hypothetical protein
MIIDRASTGIGPVSAWIALGEVASDRERLGEEPSLGQPAGVAVKDCEIVQRLGDIGPVSAWIALDEVARIVASASVNRLGVGPPAVLW